jgi:GNAT superfamily N-acetyltransferase
VVAPIARAATAEDAGEIVRLAELLWAGLGVDTTTSAWRVNALEATRRRLGNDMYAAVVDSPDGSGLVASGAAVILDRLPVPNVPDGRVGYIGWMWTDPASRSQGLARAVFRELVGWLRAAGIRRIELGSTPDGEPLYRSEGFGEGRGLPLVATFGPD